MGRRSGGFNGVEQLATNCMILTVAAGLPAMAPHLLVQRCLTHRDRRQAGSYR